MFGYENPNSKEFSWIKWFLRVIIDFIILAAISYLFAFQMIKHMGDPTLPVTNTNDMIPTGSTDDNDHSF